MRKAGIGIALLCVAALVWWWTRDDASARRTRADTVRHGAARDATARDDRHDPPAAEQAKDEEESKEGIDVTVAVHFRDGRPAAGVEVTLKRYRKLVGQTTTDSAGMATFPDRTETYLLAHVGSAAVAVLRPREDPKGVMTLPETKRVRIAVFCDGTRQVPDGLLIPELFGLQVDRSAAVVSGFTVRKANVGLPQGVRGPQTQFTLTAPGYRPVQVVVKGDPLGGEARLVRGVHTVLTVPGLRTPPYVQRIGGGSTSGSWMRSGYDYYLKPGRYIVRSAFLRSDIGVITVPDQYERLDVELEAPEFTDIKIEAPEADHLAKVFVEIGGERMLLRTRRVVLPGSEPVRFTVAHAMFLPDPDRGSVTRVQRGGVVTLVLIRAPLLRFSIRGIDTEGDVRLYAPGKYAQPVAEYTFNAPVRSLRHLVDVDGRTVNQSAQETGLAAGVALRGVYDVWIDPKVFTPILVKSVRFSGRDVDLGALEPVIGSIVRIPLTIEERNERTAFKVQSLDAPYFERTQEGNGTLWGLPKGRYAWSLGDEEGEFEADGKTHVEIYR